MTLDVRVVGTRADAVPILLAEVRRSIAVRRSVIGLATGSTFGPFLQSLGGELAARAGMVGDVVATHLDEYVGFPAERPGGIVHELCAACPALRELHACSAFVPVPSSGDAAVLRAHEERLARAGGVDVQLLGIGRNGHLAFNEPGASFDLGFHVGELAATTRDDARPRFLPDEPPTHAVTSGIATILAARRLVLCAFGAQKAAAVRAMLHGEIGVACPASAIRTHGDVLVLLDGDAASRLPV